MTPPAPALADRYLPEFEETLRENVLGFWFPRCIDDEGGFLTSYDREGDFAGNDHKQVVTQARMTWLAARLVREGYGSEYRDVADHGFAFLVGELWDDDNGGFVWEVDRDGAVVKPNKHLYGQAFGLYALSEYHRATGDERAAAHAHELVDLLDRNAKDDDHGGYVEYFTPAWEPITEGRTYLDAIEPDWSPKESAEDVLDPTLKLMNTHLHLLEGFTAYYRAFGTERGRRRLHELLDVLTTTVVRTRLGACTDKYTPEWHPKTDDKAFRIVSYGHDLENVWLTMEAADALGLAVDPFTDLYETLWEYAIEYGYDDDHGGFYFYGGFGEPARFRVKAWWVQAECLTSAIRMYEHTGDRTYLDVFTETYEFLDRHQIDREHGEWHAGVDDDLEPLGRKGAVYKAAYHNGRALLESMATLRRL